MPTNMNVAEWGQSSVVHITIPSRIVRNGRSIAGIYGSNSGALTA